MKNAATNEHRLTWFHRHRIHAQYSLARYHQATQRGQCDCCAPVIFSASSISRGGLSTSMPLMIIETRGNDERAYGERGLRTQRGGGTGVRCHQQSASSSYLLCLAAQHDAWRCGVRRHNLCATTTAARALLLATVAAWHHRAVAFFISRSALNLPPPAMRSPANAPYL